MALISSAIRNIVLVALGCALVADASKAARHAALQKEASLAKRASQPSRPSPGDYLNNKTQPFWVNGSALPDVDFDIGESYSGLLPIDHTKELFFWFTPTTNPAARDEITIWLNGGPGCSSLDGFLHEQGNFIWQAGTYKPVPNTWTWANLTNVVYIEQPVGTGFSRGTPNATNELDVAAQFLPFWKNFVDLFDLHDRKVYITGESYAGQYCPYIANAMIGQNDTKYFNVSGMMIYDPSIVTNVASEAAVVPFVDAHIDDFPFNQSFSEYLHKQHESCGYKEYLERGLTFPPKGPFNNPPGLVNGSDNNPAPGCDLFDDVFNEIFYINPCFDIYQVGQLCPLLWDVLGFPYSDFYFPVGFEQPYFNRTDVKKVIHAPQDTDWMICSEKSVFKGRGDLSPPSGVRGGPLEKVIEHTSNVIVGHGALDMVLIANGTLLTLNNLTWNGKQGFSQPPTEPFYVPYADDPIAGSIAGAGVYGGYVTERGLTFVAVSLSGHEIPEYQPSAAYRHLEFLLGRVKSLSDVSPFTTQPHVKQPQVLLGKGTWWPY